VKVSVKVIGLDECMGRIPGWKIVLSKTKSTELDSTKDIDKLI
jgi:hypothetical protein